MPGKSGVPLTLRCYGEPFWAKFVILSLLEKLRKEIYINPYRKPTQVDEERILRRLGEL